MLLSLLLSTRVLLLIIQRCHIHLSRPINRHFVVIAGGAVQSTLNSAARDLITNVVAVFVVMNGLHCKSWTRPAHHQLW